MRTRWGWRAHARVRARVGVGGWRIPLTKTDGLTHEWTYTRDLGGRKLTETDPLDHTTTYTYDEMNKVLTATGWPVANAARPGPHHPQHDALQFWDVGAGLPQILQDARTQGSTTTTTTYLYGLGLIATTDSAAAASYYLADGLGSTTQLTDASGVVTDTYTYDVFGALRSTTGSTSNPFDFAGQQTDHTANRGLQYLRARHYDPSLGRLLGRDPVPFAQRYAYAGDDPVNRIDPLGLFPPCPGCGAVRQALETGAGAVGGTIAGAADCVTDVDCSQVVSERLDEFSAYASNIRAGITNVSTVIGCAGGYVVAGGEGLAVGCLLGKGVGEAATLSLNNASNVAGVLSTVIGCSGRLLGQPKEGGGVNWKNIKSCGKSTVLTAAGFVPEANLNAARSDYQYYCLDKQLC